MLESIQKIKGYFSTFQQVKKNLNIAHFFHVQKTDCQKIKNGIFRDSKKVPKKVHTNFFLENG